MAGTYDVVINASQPEGETSYALSLALEEPQTCVDMTPLLR